jgi:hypothetical protein
LVGTNRKELLFVLRVSTQENTYIVLLTIMCYKRPL